MKPSDAMDTGDEQPNDTVKDTDTADAVDEATDTDALDTGDEKLGDTAEDADTADEVDEAADSDTTDAADEQPSHTVEDADTADEVDGAADADTVDIGDEQPGDTTEDVDTADTVDEAADSDATDTVDEQPSDTVEDTDTADAVDEAADTDAMDTADEQPNDTATDADTTDKVDEAADSDAMDTDDEQPSDIAKESNKLTDTYAESNDNSKTPLERLSEYMNQHNYGQGDYPEYSQDPEWRALQREAFPDSELPPLSQENAYNQLSEYMNAHNYGSDDFATYSQDPIWRELQSAAFPDYKLPALVDSEALSNGRVPNDIFTGTTNIWDVTNHTKLEDLSNADYNQLCTLNRVRASQMVTDYNDRHIPADDLSELPRTLPLDNASNIEVVDSELSADKATILDTTTGKEYTAYPNPIGRTSHMEGQQGQNDVGMLQDCGIASTAKGINDLYGKKVTTENRLADFAKQTGNCDLSEAIKYPDGTIDYSDCGGTVEDNVREFYNANGIDATAYTGNGVPTIDTLADSLKDGGVATVAVNHDLLWNYDEAQEFDPSMIDQARYASDSAYASRIDTYMDMHDGVGTYRADHFVNVSNAVYDSNGVLSHFIVSDTGNGTTKMIPKDYFQRAYYGLGNIRVSAKGCVIAERRK